jgi:hypothetical protein
MKIFEDYMKIMKILTTFLKQFFRDFGEFLKIFEGNEDFSEILTFWRIFDVFEEYDDR